MYPKVNQNILIELKDEEHSSRSIVADVGDKEILIGFPIDGKIAGLLHNGRKLDVTLFSGENKYIFQTEIIGRKKDKIPLFRIKKPQKNEIIRIQQRDNFRVNSNLRLVIDEQEYYTINISVGGMLFSSRASLDIKEGEMVTGKLFVPNSQSKVTDLISFQGIIKRVDVFEKDDRKNIAVEFNEVFEKDQKKIFQYCFEKQRQKRLNER